MSMGVDKTVKENKHDLHFLLFLLMFITIYIFANL